MIENVIAYLLVLSPIHFFSVFISVSSKNVIIQSTRQDIGEWRKQRGKCCKVRNITLINRLFKK